MSELTDIGLNGYVLPVEPTTPTEFLVKPVSQGGRNQLLGVLSTQMWQHDNKLPIARDRYSRIWRLEYGRAAAFGRGYATTFKILKLQTLLSPHKILPQTNKTVTDAYMDQLKDSGIGPNEFMYIQDCATKKSDGAFHQTLDGHLASLTELEDVVFLDEIRLGCLALYTLLAYQFQTRDFTNQFNLAT